MADVIGVSREDVLVIDVRDSFVCLDVLCSHLDPEKFVSKEETLLKQLGRIKGVGLEANASVVSNGMLGWIAGDDESIFEAQLEMSRSKALAEQIRLNIAKRAIVFPTGAEVEAGEIEDTNTPFIMQKLTEAGFTVDKGEVMKDDLRLFTAGLSRAAEMGYGLCITTGGVGAENKDFSVEAIQLLDSSAAAPYIAKFHAGHGRHSKDGIRICVGQEGVTTFVALPGPHDEVELCIDAVIKGISDGWSKETVAATVAGLLRTRLKEKLAEKHH
ncbi:MAG: competence/damage-inducible protein A [Firmicutes bacterium]|nr:competence/damage-inducible protein A [Bacillota bacterium]